MMSSVPQTELIVNIGNDKIYLYLKEKLGAGAFGTVVRAEDKRGESFALKSIVCKDSDAYESIARELDILMKLKHPNIVSLYGFDFDNSTAVLVLEYCAEGTLNKRLFSPVDVRIQLQWMEQLSTALLYLHKSNIVHRDLKTENVLLTDESNVKLADFGIARHFVCCKTGRIANNDPNNYISEYLDAYMGSFAGTPFWVAPEVFDNLYTEKADIFSLGVIFHAICERRYLTFQGERYYGTFTDHKGQSTGIGLAMYEQQKIIEPEFGETSSKNIKSSITSMLSLNPESRISLDDLRVEISEAYCDVLQGENLSQNVEKPPIVIKNQDEHYDDRRGMGSVLSSLCCRRYVRYNSIE